MRTRLRPTYSSEELAEIYKQPHNHMRWEDHKYRVNTSIGMLRTLLPVDSIADLSAGDSFIISNLDASKKYVGDFAPRYEFSGPIEQSINQIPKVDLFICSETLEHLDDPDMVLAKIREKTDWLFISTPDGEDNTNNPEHYWGWDTEGIEQMLRTAGFTPKALNVLGFFDPRFPYKFQMWLAR